MKRVVAVVVLAMLLVPGVAFAGSSTDAALGLGAFAALGTLLLGAALFGGHSAVAAPAPVVVTPPPPALYSPPPVLYRPAPPVVYAPAPPPVVYRSAPPRAAYAPWPRHDHKRRGHGRDEQGWYGRHDRERDARHGHWRQR